MNEICAKNIVPYVLNVLEFVRKVEEARGRDPESVYLCGNCGNLYTHLKYVFKCARPQILLLDNGAGHVRTQIGDTYFDITGASEDPNFCYECSDGARYTFTPAALSAPNTWEEIMTMRNNYVKPGGIKGCNKVQESKLMKETQSGIKSYIETEEFKQL
jgi:hypothetical protein